MAQTAACAPVTRKQLLYVTEFMFDFSARNACARAGYEWSECPHHLPQVKAAIQRLMRQALAMEEPLDDSPDAFERELVESAKAMKDGKAWAPYATTMRLLAQVRGYIGAGKAEKDDEGLSADMFGGSSEPPKEGG